MYQLSITFKQITTMRKSLNKKAFQAYILSCIDPESYGVTATTPKELINFVIETFEKEYWHEYNQKYYGNKQIGFANYLMGLPSCIKIDFENFVINELGKEFGLLDQTSKESDFAKWRESWYYRVANEVFRLYTKLNK